MPQPDNSEDFQDDREQRLDQRLADFMRQVDGGGVADPAEFLRQQDDPELADLLKTVQWVEQMAGPPADREPADREPDEGSPHEAAAEAVDVDPSATGHGDTDETADFRSNVAEGDGDSDAESQPPMPRLFGNYLLLEQIGAGGMGLVFSAQQAQPSRTVAVKLLSGARFADTEERARFQAEAEAAGRLGHPRIVSVYEAGVIDGQPYFSMELIEGGHLGEWADSQPRTAEEIARVMISISETVHYAHEHGILHRDLKPANILIDERENPRLTDFGLSKQLDRDQALTTTGVTLGTPTYMAPEQAAGKLRELTAAADIYSLGAILYRLLVGRPPFRGETTVETILQVQHAQPRWPGDRRIRDQGLESICLKCLEKSPGSRYATAAELAEDLQRRLDGRPVHARRHGLIRQANHWLANVPLVARIVGNRFCQPSAAQRWTSHLLLIVPTLCLLIYLTLVVYTENSLPKHVIVMGGTPEGAYHRVAAELQDRLQTDRMQVEAKRSAGSTENIQAVAERRATIGLAQRDVVSDHFDEVRIVAPIFSEPTLVLVKREDPEDLGKVTSISDAVEGLPLFIGDKRSGSQATAERLIRELELQPSREVAESYHRLASVAAGAAITVGRPEQDSDLEAFVQRADVTWVVFSEEEFEHIVYSSYRRTRVALDGKRGLTIGTEVCLIVHSRCRRRLVQHILGALYDPEGKSPPLPDAHPGREAAQIMVDDSQILHAAARKHFSRWID